MSERRLAQRRLSNALGKMLSCMNLRPHRRRIWTCAASVWSACSHTDVLSWVQGVFVSSITSLVDDDVCHSLLSTIAASEICTAMSADASTSAFGIFTAAILLSFVGPKFQTVVSINTRGLLCTPTYYNPCYGDTPKQDTPNFWKSSPPSIPIYA